MQPTKFITYILIALTLCSQTACVGGKGIGEAGFVNPAALHASMGQGFLGKNSGDTNLDNYGDVGGDGVAGSLDDYGDSGSVDGIADPLEPWNRFWFGFNDIFYLYIAKPVHGAYDAIMPDQLQTGLSNFLKNLLFPARFVNALLQGKFKLAGVEMSRFIVNSTVGFAGFIDVAASKKTVVPWTRDGEDFGQTLGHWGVGDGFYLVLPFIGPSSLRDGVGSAVNFFIDPLLYADPTFISSGIVYGLYFNEVGGILSVYDSTKKVAVDPYIAMREAYVAFRKQQVLK